MGSLHSGKLFFSVVCRSGDVREPLARARSRTRILLIVYIHSVHSRMCTCFVRFRDVYRSKMFVCGSRTHTRTHAPPVKLNLLTRLLGSCAQCVRAHTTRRRFAGRTNASGVCVRVQYMIMIEAPATQPGFTHHSGSPSRSIKSSACTQYVHTIRCVFI